MNVICNRAFLLISPKKPFADWLLSHEDFDKPEEEIYVLKSLYAVRSLAIPSE